MSNRNRRKSSTNNGGKSRYLSTLPTKLFDSVGNYNWSLPLGTSVPYGDQWSAKFGAWRQESLPVLQTFDVNMNLGVSENVNDPAYTLATTMFNYIIRINSANVPYDPVDIELAMFAASQVYAFIAASKRIYRLLNTYSMHNRSLPRVLFDAHDLDFNSFNKQTSDFKAWMDEYILFASQLAFPADVPFFDNFDQLFSNVYVDSSNEKAQMYMFIPDCFYYYDELTEAGRLCPIPLRSVKCEGVADNEFGAPWTSTVGTQIWEARDHKITAAEWMEIGNRMLYPLIQSQDINRINADIFKAYGANKLHKIDLLPIGESLNALYDPMILAQIENCVLLPHARVITEWDGYAPNSLGLYYPVISQNPSIQAGYLQFEYYPWSYAADNSLTIEDEDRSMWDKVMTEMDYVLNWHGTNYPSPAEAMEIVRFAPTVLKAGMSHGVKVPMRVSHCSTEILVGSRIYFMVYDEAAGSVSANSWVEFDGYCFAKGQDTTNNLFNKIAKLDKFDWHMKVVYVQYEPVSGYQNTAVFQDMDTYSIVPIKDINQMHRIRIIGQFKCPGYDYAITKS